MYKRILFATDGSAFADIASAQLDHLCDWQTEVRVVVVLQDANSLAIPDEVPLEFDSTPESLQELTEAVMLHAREQLESLSIPADIQLVDISGEPGNDIATAVAAEAESWGAELLLLGAHGRGGYRESGLGNVADQIIRECRCSVMLVKGTAPASAPG